MSSSVTQSPGRLVILTPLPPGSVGRAPARPSRSRPGGLVPIRPAVDGCLAVVAGVLPTWVDLAADTAAATVLFAELGSVGGESSLNLRGANAAFNASKENGGTLCTSLLHNCFRHVFAPHALSLSRATYPPA